jgi:hypothetical protein
MGEGRNPGTTQLQALGKKHGIKRAAKILERVREVVACWDQHAANAGVSRKSAKEIAAKLMLR